jgi:hypothetical protein
MTDPRQLAYDAVYEYIRSQPRGFLPTTVVGRNAMIWRSVNAALDAQHRSAEVTLARVRDLAVQARDHTAVGIDERREKAETDMLAVHPPDQPSARADAIAYRIRAELVCCHIYDRVNDTHELTIQQAMESRDWHDLCYWGEASARIAEGRCPGYKTEPNICRCSCDGCKSNCSAHQEAGPESSDTDLTAEEARDLADDLGLQLYRAQDALAFVEECCVIAEREGRPITVADVRTWLKGAQCGRQLAAGGQLDVGPASPPVHLVTWTGAANNAEQSPRTTADNSPTSSDTPDNSALHGLIRQAIHDADEHSCQEQDGVDYDQLTAAALAAIHPLGKFLGDMHRDAEADLSRVIDLYEQWCKAGPPPLGISVSRWWDRRLVELRQAIVEPVEQIEQEGE